MVELRPYQNDAVEGIRREFAAGRQRTLLVLPTGGG
jgi:superfamily II DNA or RNA helicase